jgi:protease-4
MDAEAILERRRLRRRASFWRAAAFIVLIVAILAAVSFWTDRAGLMPRAAVGEVADIKVDGFIPTRPDAVEVIERATKSASVKAIMLHIDSPGGAASGGEALYRAVRNASEEKPVVAVIDGLGASAAYMTAIAADHIVARESAITGSIGVIFQYGHFEDLLTKIGVDYEEVRSGPLKGEPSIFREPDPAGIAMIEGVVKDSYDWFVGLVALRRNLPQAEARRLSNGSIYTGRQALALKLIDAVGSDEQARAWLADEKGISRDLPLTEWKKDEGFFGMFRSDATAGLARLLGIDETLARGVEALLPRRLMVDGLLSVWQAPLPQRSGGQP